MKKIITTALAVLTLATSGCLNIMQHANGKAVPFSGCGSAFQGTAFTENPIFILALPFEFVADMITLPYDYFNTRRDASRPDSRSEGVAAHIAL